MRASCPRCKIALARQREVERHVDTTEGWVGYRRMRYTCRKCQKGYYPFDVRLELSADSRMSKRKERELVHLAARLPYEEAKEVIMQYKKASASLLQRRLQIGYARAARILDALEENGVIGPQEGSKPREILSFNGQNNDEPNEDGFIDASNVEIKR